MEIVVFKFGKRTKFCWSLFSRFPILENEQNFVGHFFFNVEGCRTQTRRSPLGLALPYLCLRLLPLLLPPPVKFQISNVDLKFKLLKQNSRDNFKLMREFIAFGRLKSIEMLKNKNVTCSEIYFAQSCSSPSISSTSSSLASDSSLRPRRAKKIKFDGYKLIY